MTNLSRIASIFVAACLYLSLLFVASCKKDTPTPPPVISSFTPDSGYPNTQVTITGLHFNADQTLNKVEFNGTVATVISATTTQIIVVVPASATTGKIAVTTNGKKGTSDSDFTVLVPPPFISSFTPTSGYTDLQVTITGANFKTGTSSNKVEFNGVQAAIVSATTSQIIARVPAGATTGKIAVTTDGVKATSDNDFTITLPPPMITSFTPAAGYTDMKVTIAGSNFGVDASSNKVEFNGTRATILSATTSEIVVQVPAGATTGKIAVTTDGRTGSSLSNFTVGDVYSIWTNAGQSLEDLQINTFAVHPQDDNLWFASTEHGLYSTRDGGINWSKHLTGYSLALEIDQHNPSNIYASSDQEIYASTDQGRTWSQKYTFPAQIVSIMASAKDGSIYVGIRWGSSETANGIYKSVDGGNTWQYYSFNVTQKGLILWDIEEDTLNNKIYVSTEIYNHPSPYHPPFLRSSDGGKTWTNIAGILPWHAIKIQVHPIIHDVYALLEGPGIYRSSDFGDYWTYMGVPFEADFLIDKKNPDRSFGSNVNFGSFTGGVYQSDNGGLNYQFLGTGLAGYTTAGLSLNGASTLLYVACYNHGIFSLRLH